MFKKKLSHSIKERNSLLCIGLDPDIERIPSFLLKEKDPLYTFNREIIEATKDITIAYKPNIAFYETLGSEGWHLLDKTLQLIPAECIIIADAKRGDIGNTSRKYAELYFQSYRFDAITVNPYMGFDSISAFMEYENCAVFVLCLTSNKGSCDFQYLNTEGEPLYIKIARQVLEWDLNYGNCGLVVGATHPEDLGSLREMAPITPFLIPGIGAQGGNLQTAVQYGTDESAGCALINSSRSIIYASSDTDFAEGARIAAQNLNKEINEFRRLKENFEM
jgi:orotidine-5'-phosphate decarboxylase